MVAGLGDASRSPTPFLVLPLRETPTELPRSPGVVAIVVLSVVAVGLGGMWPAVTRSLEATTNGLADGELWRLVTYVFPHEHGWLHVTVNMGVLALFGWQLERMVGTVRFLFIYIGSGAVGMALLFAFNPIDAARGIRSGASLAVFGAVAALTTCHGLRGGRRAPALAWALPTCAVLLVAAGVRQVGGKEGLIEPGVAGFSFGFLNHALGMVAGGILGVAVAPDGSRGSRAIAGVVAASTMAVGLWVGAARWT